MVPVNSSVASLALNALLGQSARQTSLLDVFSVRSSSKKNSPATSGAASENGSVAGDDVIDILSSDTEPLERPVDSSSPITVEDGSEAGGLSEISNVASGESLMALGPLRHIGR